ncbi:hypothetical protein JL475_24945 [Streptomyces sp. M2CJ-2]|uniref:hypothetical protein n=1 Tax=Streptomyces sp. M2CJ-2 TaxID=2803948 RepID=UPI001928EFA3|nr:hypothetical protein [Streptomyces sp. M2CJ-2]MBL3669179.1 hypothetical protein [Streptomyces sp. M2CJ-2]
MKDVGAGADASGLHEPLADGGGDVFARCVDAAGEDGCVVATGLRGAVGALLGVVRALTDAGLRAAGRGAAGDVPACG